MNTNTRAHTRFSALSNIVWLQFQTCTSCPWIWRSCDRWSECVSNPLRHDGLADDTHMKLSGMQKRRQTGLERPHTHTHTCSLWRKDSAYLFIVPFRIGWLVVLSYRNVSQSLFMVIKAVCVCWCWCVIYFYTCKDTNVPTRPDKEEIF